MAVSRHLKQCSLQWSIGSAARKHLQQNGLRVDDIDLMIGASGGPKWLALAGLDRALFGAFLHRRSRPLTTLASSIGSWRFAAMAQTNPVAALDRFLEAYLEQRYQKGVNASGVSAVLNQVLDHMLGADGAAEILQNPVFRNHIVTIRCRGPLASERRLLQSVGLAALFGINLLQRDRLGQLAQRFVFYDRRDEPLEFGDGISVEHGLLRPDNLRLALEASAAVPLVLAGVGDIPGAPAGMYRDGGVTDYHFDHRVAASRGLVFYPHFYSSCIPGWFDKALKSRWQDTTQWSNLIMVSPAPEFVAALPGGKIPDRKDFTAMDDQQRLDFWRTTVAESERLGDAFLEAVEKQDFFG